LRGRQWHTSQRFLELPGGAAVLQMRLNGLEEVERWVLGWGAHATVLRPTALLERIRKTAVELVERYGSVDVED
jgi:predicted DNA-binding transcriptional regulator YafY